MRKIMMLSVWLFVAMLLIGCVSAIVVTSRTNPVIQPIVKPLTPLAPIVAAPINDTTDDSDDEDGSILDIEDSAIDEELEVDPDMYRDEEEPDHIAVDNVRDLEVDAEPIEGLPHTCPEEPNYDIELVCPETDTLGIDWPQRPYDFSAGDCMIKGKEAQVQAYIDELSVRLMECYNSIPENVEGFNVQKHDIVYYLENVPDYDPNCEIEAENEEGGDMNIGAATISEPSLPMFEGCTDIMDSSPGIFEEEGTAFTRLLMSMEEAVNETCTASSILNEDLVCMCDDISGYVNNKEWLWPDEKKEVISEIEHIRVELNNTQHIAGITVDWFNYMNNSFNVYYDPHNIAICGAPKEMLSPAVARALRLTSYGLVKKSRMDVEYVYSVAMRETDNNVEDLKIRDDGFDLKYKKKAKVLGLIPAEYTLIVNATDEKVISVKKPWWLFLASDDADETVGAIDEELSARVQIQMDRRSKIIETLSNIMKKISSTMDNQTQNIK